MLAADAKARADIGKAHAAAAGHRPVAPQADRDADQRQEKGRQEDRHHDPVRHHGIEPFAAFRLQGAGGEEQRRKTGGRRRGDCRPALVEGAGEAARHRKILPAFAADGCQCRRQVEGEFMRFRILAGIIAAAAIVAEIGELGDVAEREGALAVDCRKDGAEALAIAAGVADLDLGAVPRRPGPGRSARR